MPLHAQRERFQALKKQKRMQRSKCSPGIPQKDCSDSGNKSGFTRGLGKADAMIAWIRLCELRKFSAGLPIKLSAVHNHPADRRTVAADKFSSGMHHNIRTVFKRTKQIRCSKSGICYQRNFMPMRCRSSRLDVNQRGIRIADGFNKNSFCLFVNGCFKGIRFIRIYKFSSNAVLRKRMC